LVQKQTIPGQSGRSLPLDFYVSKQTILTFTSGTKADDPKTFLQLKADDHNEELKDESRRSWTKYLGIKADDLRMILGVMVQLGSG